MIDYEKLFCENVENAAKEMINGKVVCKVLKDTLVVSVSSNGFYHDYIPTDQFSKQFAKGSITSQEVAIEAIKAFKRHVNKKIFKMSL